MQLFLVDGLAPFCTGLPARRVNWSKVPFSHWEQGGRLDTVAFRRAADDFDRYCRRAADCGFNAITLDDVAHVADSPRYPAAVRAYVQSYREAYAGLFASAAQAGLRIFLNSDALFSHRDVPGPSEGGGARPWGFLRELVEDVLDSFPGIEGLIFRVGEVDGRDVHEAFTSRLAIRTPSDAQAFLQALLPAFEQRRRTLILRTWSVGAHRIGDLIWNRDTFQRVFGAIRSERLIISMKFGETDFFRYLPLNQQFFLSPHRKLVELPARREYEGCGMFPSFVGFDYARYLSQLEGAENLEGVMVWCQTGGWTRFHPLTWLEGGSVWNEINAWVTLRLCRDRQSPEQAVQSWCDAHGRGAHVGAVLELLRLSDEVVHELLYIDEFAERKLFFRRLRVPPLLNVYWDQILVSHAMKRILRCFVRDGDRLIRQAHDALRKIRRMERLARACGLPARDLAFMFDTFEILAAAREYYFLPYQPILVDRLRKLCADYRAKWPVRYAVHLDFARARLSRRALRVLFALLLRKRRGYRILDRMFTLSLISRLYPVLGRRARLIPSFAYERAMGVDAVFK